MIGIIGGAGPFASALLYRYIIEECYEKQDKDSIPEILLLNHVFPRGLTLQESAKRGALLQKELQQCLRFLRKAGATRISLACNTLHAFLPKPHPEEVIHLPNAVLDHLRKQKRRHIGVLSTETTKALALYNDAEIQFHYPSQDEQMVMNSILDRILEGQILAEDSLRVEQFIQAMKERDSISGAILGCTDLSVLHDRYPIRTRDVLVFDTMRILARILSR